MRQHREDMSHPATAATREPGHQSPISLSSLPNATQKGPLSPLLLTDGPGLMDNRRAEATETRVRALAPSEMQDVPSSLGCQIEPQPASQQRSLLFALEDDGSGHEILCFRDSFSGGCSTISDRERETQTPNPKLSMSLFCAVKMEVLFLLVHLLWAAYLHTARDGSRHCPPVLLRHLQCRNCGAVRTAGSPLSGSAPSITVSCSSLETGYQLRLPGGDPAIACYTLPTGSM